MAILSDLDEVTVSFWPKVPKRMCERKNVRVIEQGQPLAARPPNDVIPENRLGMLNMRRLARPSK